MAVNLSRGPTTKDGKQLETGRSITEQSNIAEEPSEEEVDVSPLFEYLKSDQGHEIAVRIVGIIDDVKRASIDRNFAYAKYGTLVSAGIVVSVILASGVLAYLQKFDTPIALLFGTVVGYFFGKK